MNKFILFFIICLQFSCKENTTPIHISKLNTEITLPAFVKEDELTDDAYIEYANRYRNFYIVAMELPKNQTQDSQWSINSDRILKSLQKTKIDTFHQLNAIKTVIKGNYIGEKESIYYTQYLINNHLLTIWTRGDERYKKYKSTIDEIIASYKVKS